MLQAASSQGTRQRSGSETILRHFLHPIFLSLHFSVRRIRAFFAFPDFDRAGLTHRTGGIWTSPRRANKVLC